MRHPVEDLKGKEVIVVAEGVEYKGILVEVSDTDVTLSTETRWISIPQTKISQIYEAGKPPEVEHPHSIPPDFWDEKFDPSK